MADLVYVSAAKLADLQHSRQQMQARGTASGWMSRLTGRVRAAVTVPFLNGEVAMESQPPAKQPLPRVRSAIKWLEQGQQPPVVQEEAASAQQWIRFHKPVGYSVLEGAVVFLEPGGDDAGNPASDQRLLLHGAEQHLLHRTSVQQTSVHDFSEQAATAEGRLPEDWVNYASLFGPFLGKLAYADERDANREYVEGWLHGEHDILARAIPQLERHLALPYTKGWMSGHALVTGIVPIEGETVVLASPLYVQRSSPPSSTA